MLYKIVKVTDLDFRERMDSDSLDRMKRAFIIQESTLAVGSCLLLLCVEPEGGKSVRTSLIEEITKADDGYIIKTLNSCYFIVEKDAVERSEYVMGQVSG